MAELATLARPYANAVFDIAKSGGELDRWLADGEDPSRDIAARLIAAANHVGSIRARPETIWFLLWEMEGMLSDLRDLLEPPDTERPDP